MTQTQINASRILEQIKEYSDFLNSTAYRWFKHQNGVENLRKLVNGEVVVYACNVKDTGNYVLDNYNLNDYTFKPANETVTITSNSGKKYSVNLTEVVKRGLAEEVE